MNAFRRAPLTLSILLVIGIYGVLEAIAFTMVAAAFGFSAAFLALYLGIQFAFHIALGLFLLGGSSFFYNVNTGERLTRVNAANKITLLRISMLPSVLFMIVAAKDFRVAPILIPALAVTFLTDLVDGRISRAKNQVTLMGKILDSVSDYSLLIVVAVAYYVYKLIPGWLFWIIASRLFFQAIGMLCILLIRKSVETKTTIFGKAAIATIMSLFAVEALKFIRPGEPLPYNSHIEAAAGIIVALSILDKGYFFARSILSSGKKA
jgi:phosphatidylglycerophosphate synthase